MRRAKAPILFVLALLLAVFVLDRLTLRGAAPPPGVADLKAFLEWNANASRFHVVRKDGREHLAVMAGPRGLLSHGPSAYVFEKSGRLLEWTADTRSDHAFRQRWPIEAGGTELNERTAPGWVEPAGGPPCP